MTKRSTRQIRAYEDTALLIEAVMRASNEHRTFADVLDEWARTIYPEVYEEIIESRKRIDDKLRKD